MEFKRYSTTLWPYQVKALRSISSRTGLPQAYMVREAIDDYLKKHGEVVKRKDG